MPMIMIKQSTLDDIYSILKTMDDADKYADQNDNPDGWDDASVLADCRQVLRQIKKDAQKGDKKK